MFLVHKNSYVFGAYENIIQKYEDRIRVDFFSKKRLNLKLEIK